MWTTLMPQVGAQSHDTHLSCEEFNWKISATSQLVFSNMIQYDHNDFSEGILVNQLFALDIFDTRVVTTAQATYGTLVWMYFTRLL